MRNKQVGAERFELSTFCSQSRHANRTALCPEYFLLIFKRSGEGGIRTPGGVTLVGFQDRCIKPLCHLSEILSLFF